MHRKSRAETSNASLTVNEPTRLCSYIQIYSEYMDHIHILNRIYELYLYFEYKYKYIFRIYLYSEYFLLFLDFFLKNRLKNRCFYF